MCRLWRLHPSTKVTPLNKHIYFKKFCAFGAVCLYNKYYWAHLGICTETKSHRIESHISGTVWDRVTKIGMVMNGDGIQVTSQGLRSHGSRSKVTLAKAKQWFQMKADGVTSMSYCIFLPSLLQQWGLQRVVCLSEVLWLQHINLSVCLITTC